MTSDVLLDLDKVCSHASLASVVSSYQCLDEVREWHLLRHLLGIGTFSP